MSEQDAPPEQVTLAVLGERLNNALALLTEVRTAVADPIHGNGANRATLENHEARLRTLESWQTWGQRTILGVVVLAVLAVVIVPQVG